MPCRIAPLDPVTVTPLKWYNGGIPAAPPRLRPPRYPVLAPPPSAPGSQALGAFTLPDGTTDDGRMAFTTLHRLVHEDTLLPIKVMRRLAHLETKSDVTPRLFAGIVADNATYVTNLLAVEREPVHMCAYNFMDVADWAVYCGRTRMLAEMIRVSRRAVVEAGTAEAPLPADRYLVSAERAIYSAAMQGKWNVIRELAVPNMAASWTGLSLLDRLLAARIMWESKCDAIIIELEEECALVYSRSSLKLQEMSKEERLNVTIKQPWDRTLQRMCPLTDEEWRALEDEYLEMHKYDASTYRTYFRYG